MALSDISGGFKTLEESDDEASNASIRHKKDKKNKKGNQNAESNEESLKECLLFSQDFFLPKY